MVNPSSLLYGPFSQIVTMDDLPSAGPLQDSQLEIVAEGGILVENGFITDIGPFEQLKGRGVHHEVPRPSVAIPGLIDAHTHACYAGSRATDYAKRVSGMTYQEIAASGGGIHDTVKSTRAASEQLLEELLLNRMSTALSDGVTTCEIKSGYGLSLDDELKILRVIKTVSKQQPVDLVPTCLAAHVRPPEFQKNCEYLDHLKNNLLPLILKEKLAKRIDIFVEENAFSVDEARAYLTHAKNLGFSVCLHADQFSRGGVTLASEINALSADHLEVSNSADALALKKSNVIPVVLPGASLGLGMHFAPARLFLDHHLPLVIASDWNPGSAPMGKLLLQAAVLGAYEHLTIAETLAAITYRAAKALELDDRGILARGKRADIAIYSLSDYREILYYQGSSLPSMVISKGIRVW